MKKVLERQSNLTLKQATIDGILREPKAGPDGTRFVLRAHTSQRYAAKTLVITAGTSLRGRTITGEATRAESRAGEPPAMGISDCLHDWGLDLGRLKTGTPPRVDARTIDFGETLLQPGSPSPLSFGFYYPAQTRRRHPGSLSATRSIRSGRRRRGVPNSPATASPRIPAPTRSSSPTSTAPPCSTARSRRGGRATAPRLRTRCTGSETRTATASSSSRRAGRPTRSTSKAPTPVCLRTLRPRCCARFRP